MRVLVCGSRTFANYGQVAEVLHGIYVMHSLGHLLVHAEDMTIVHGKAPGADTLADEWARATGPHPGPDTNPDVCGVFTDTYRADWNTHHPDWCGGEWCRKQRYCKAAGPRRNQEMLDKGNPLRVVAFIDKPLPKSRGTNDMVTRAKAAGLPIMVVRVG